VSPWQWVGDKYCDKTCMTLDCGHGLTLVHFIAQRKHFLWDTLGTFSK